MLKLDCLLFPVQKLQTAFKWVQGPDCLVGHVSSCVVASLLCRIRDLPVMSLTSYRAALPCNKCFGAVISVLKLRCMERMKSGKDFWVKLRIAYKEACESHY